MTKVHLGWLQWMGVACIILGGLADCGVLLAALMLRGTSRIVVTVLLVAVVAFGLAA